MMNHTRRVFVCLLGLVVILSILVFPVSAQGNDSGAAKSEEDYLLQSQRNLDRSLSVLNTVATLMGVLVTILAIVIAVVGYLGFLEIKKWRDKRKEIEADAEIIKAHKNKVEEYVETMRSKAKNIPQTVSTEKPSDEVLRKLDEFSHNFETLELLGASLKPEDYLNMGNDFYYKNNFDSALKAFNKAIEFKPNYADAWYNKGTALGKLGQNEESIKAFDKVIELKPDDAIAWFKKGFALGELGQIEESIKAYDKAIEMKPDEAMAWFNRACNYSLMGNKEKALSNLKKAIELDVSYKEKAKKDEDFKTLWNDADFKKLVE